MTGIIASIYIIMLLHAIKHAEYKISRNIKRSKITEL